MTSTEENGPSSASRQLLRDARSVMRARREGGEHPHQRGMTLLAAGRADDAVTAFLAAIELMPDAPWSRLGLGDARWLQGDAAGATAAYRDALARTPTGAGALLGTLGAAFERVGDLETAVTAYRRALDADPAQRAHRVGLARSLAELARRHLDEAAAVLGAADLSADELAVTEAVLELAPRAPGLLRRHALALAESGSSDRAIGLLHLALAHDPDDVAAVAAVARLLPASASSPVTRRVLVDLADDLVARGRATLDVLVARARLLDEDGGAPESVAAWEAVVDAAPDDARWHKELGDRLAACGRLEEAGTAYDRAIARGFDPGFAGP